MNIAFALRHPSKLWYAFKCWAWKRYTTVKPRTLGHTWCDRTELLAHMMFEILSQFVENECSPGHIDWYYEPAHKITVNGREKYVRDEIQELYNWWHQQYLVRYPAIEDNLWAAVRAHDNDHHITNLRKEGGGLYYWDPTYDTPENKVRGRELIMRVNWLEQAAKNALNKRLERILAIRRYMWT